MRLRLQQRLKDLKQRLLVMGGMTEQAIQHSLEAYRVRDTSICDLVDYEGHAIQRFEREIDQMTLATGMMRNALFAFIDVDAALAQAVLSRDDSVDRLNDGVQSALSSLIERQPELVPQALSTMMIAHSLARIAHQSKKVAADVIFWVRGAGVQQHV